MKVIKGKAFLVGLFASCAMAMASQAADIHSDTDIHAQALQKMQALQTKFQLPSLSVAVMLDGELIFADAVGLADVEKQVKATNKTQYSAGSIAKSMTGLALGTLLQREGITLDSKVQDFVNLPETYAPISLRQLASHTAGVAHDTPERDVLEFDRPHDRYSPREVLDVFSSHALLFNPGEGFKYSSNGYILLSAFIEAASQDSYVDYMQKAVWQPLGMRQTQMDYAVPGANEATYYQGQNAEGQFTLSPQKRDRSFLFGGGGFISTPSDLVRLGNALIDERLLNESTRELVMTPVPMSGGEMNPQSYALGWRVGKISLDNGAKPYKTVHHGGVTDKAATAFLLVIPEKRAAVAFATNTLPARFWEMRPEAVKILTQFLN